MGLYFDELPANNRKSNKVYIFVCVNAHIYASIYMYICLHTHVFIRPLCAFSVNIYLSDTVHADSLIHYF